MKKFAITSIIFIFITSCGPSAEEKTNIAAVTCSIMGETRNMDAAVRVREMNDAREKIGGEIFLGGDDAIQEAFEWGLCQELVLNESYNETLQLLKDAKRERERIAEEELAELRVEWARIEVEQKAKKAAEQKAKKAAEQKAEKERIAVEQKIAKENEARFMEGLNEALIESKISLNPQYSQCMNGFPYLTTKERKGICRKWLN